MVARVWSPDTPPTGVVVAHDGPDYHRYGELGRYTAAMIGAGRVPPYHLVLLPPGERFEWYSASPAYARALAGDVLPKLAAELGTDRPVVGVGASLGALAMLHAPAPPPGRVRRAVPAVRQLLPAAVRPAGVRLPALPADRPVHRPGRCARADGPAVPVALTCGAVEENLANNRDMAKVLRAARVRGDVRARCRTRTTGPAGATPSIRT